MNKRIPAIAALAVLVPAAGSAAEGEVNVYSARHYDTDQAMYDDFTAATGIEVNLIEGEADQLIERIKAEGQNSPADVLITVDAGRLWRAEEAGVLGPVDSDVLDAKVPEHLRHPEGLWFGLSQRLRGIVYAKDRVDPAEITTYEDPGRSGVAGAGLHPLLDQRLQPVAGRLDDRGARRRGRPRPGRRGWSTTSRARRRAATPTRSWRWRPASAMSRWSTTTTSCG